MGRYTVSAASSAGPLSLLEPLTFRDALLKAVELRDSGFESITLINVESGAEIADLEDLMRDWDPDA